MSNFRLYFKTVQSICRKYKSMDDAMAQVLSFVQKNKREFKKKDYWKLATPEDISAIATHLKSWAKTGFTKLSRAKQDWDCLHLDLGDGPDTYTFFRFKYQAAINEKSFRRLLFSTPIVELDDYYSCISQVNAIPDDDDLLAQQINLTDHNLNYGLTEIPILARKLDMPDSYLFWLSMGALSMVDFLQYPDVARNLLKGHKRIYLVCGFECIYFYLGTITKEGLLFEKNVPSTKAAS